MALIVDWFRRPFPIVDSSKDKLLIASASGVVVVATLLLIRPFGITSIEETFYFLIGFGVIDFAFTALNLFLLPHIIPSSARYSSWTTGKNFLVILWILFTIAIANYLYGNHFISNADTKAPGLISWIRMTFSLGIFPVAFILLFLEKRSFVENHKVDRNLPKCAINREREGLKKQILFQPKDGDTMIVDGSNLLCVKAEGGNYSSVFWDDSTCVKKALIRMTLSSICESTHDASTIVRCHRSYIINLNKVTSFHGNARSATVQLEGLDFNVPLSRSFSREALTKTD
ncbi:MAG: LytTR family DNA-binding domain-containing protein [Bacteroidota bacterium]